MSQLSAGISYKQLDLSMSPVSTCRSQAWQLQSQHWGSAGLSFPYMHMSCMCALTVYEYRNIKAILPIIISVLLCEKRICYRLFFIKNEDFNILPCLKIQFARHEWCTPLIPALWRQKVIHSRITYYICFVNKSQW